MRVMRVMSHEGHESHESHEGHEVMRCMMVMKVMRWLFVVYTVSLPDSEIRMRVMLPRGREGDEGIKWIICCLYSFFAGR